MQAPRSSGPLAGHTSTKIYTVSSKTVYYNVLCSLIYNTATVGTIHMCISNEVGKQTVVYADSKMSRNRKALQHWVSRRTGESENKRKHTWEPYGQFHSYDVRALTERIYSNRPMAGSIRVGITMRRHGKTFGVTDIRCGVGVKYSRDFLCFQTSSWHPSHYLCSQLSFRGCLCAK